VASALRTKQYKVELVEPKQTRSNPPAPFTTSTLQQEASRKLGFGAKMTMTLAQRLYEGVEYKGETTGLITYMRTDGVTVSNEAVFSTRSLIGQQYGDAYVPSSPRMYKTKSKNAQEAHEAIRPTDVARTPAMVESYLDRDMFRLYELVWKRMVASQMESAVYDQVVVDIASNDNEAKLRANGSVIKFDGYLKLYHEDRDDPSDDEEEDGRILPPLNAGENTALKEIEPKQHFTEPPPRYSEASLVKKLEELGIGRPSTYASILSVLQERNYVRLDKKRFYAESRGRLVTAFLVSFFTRYVEYDFTALLEERLDDISAGDVDWKTVLRDWWGKFIGKVEEAKKLKTSEVLDHLDELLGNYLFHPDGTGKDPRACTACGTGRLGLKLGRFGAFIGCSNYPECNNTKQLEAQISESRGNEQGTGEGSDAVQFPKVLGQDPNGEEVTLRKGPYGIYAQLGAGEKPKRSALPKGTQAANVTLEMALSLLRLPRDVGTHPDTGKVIKAGIGRFGPYIQHDKTYASIKGDDDVLTIGINRAVTLLAEKAAKGASRNAAEAIKMLGEHPDGGEVGIYKGRYGAYVKHGSTNATLPKGSKPESLTMDEAVELLAARAGKGGKKKAASKSKAKKEPAAKPAAAKKAPAKKKAAAKK